MNIDFTYNAFVKDVIDGDTLVLSVDLGFRVYQLDRFRLKGVNTPETIGRSKKKGLAAKLFVIGMVLGKEVTIKTHKDENDKYGRFLAEVFINNQLLNQMLLDKGYAKPYDGTGKVK